MVRALLLVLGLTTLIIVVLADTSVDMAPCDEILTLLPPEFETLEVVACTDKPAAFARARLELVVPAAQAVAWSERLTDIYGMGQLRFVCCGYEPAGGIDGSIPFPDGLIAAGPPETVTSLAVSMVAEGISPDGDVIGLGDAPATLYLTLLDV